ncbi:hypothetical protein PIB30_021321 [Stylosanthes scabra]|uniref:Uncharacterized protein n=1 Tax=Stylosanthes scabra TaxID=79078 RepID=A0ABU6Z8B0_9FABA|nr:hypothetical protein [Stylosanthes scabra]
MENLNTAKDMEKIRNTLLEQISRLPHTPSVPFQTTPSTIPVPEEAEEDMERRPKPRIWSGDDYDSDHDEDEKANIKSSNLNDYMSRDVPDDMEEEKPVVPPPSGCC